MSIQWMDNFNSYGTGGTGVTNMLQGTPYISIAPASGAHQLVADPDVTATGYVLQCGGTNDNSNTLDSRLAIPVPSKQIGVGARWYFVTLPGTSGTRPVLYSYRDVTNSKIYELILETNGSLSLYAGDGSQLATTTVPVVAASSWTHIACKIDTAAGTVRVEVEGVNQTALSAYTFSATNALFYILGWSSRQNLISNVDAGYYIKDFVLWDSAGSVNNGMLGTVGVYRLPVSADVSTGWSSTGANNWSVLNETPPVDSSYISAGSALPAASVMEFADLPANIVGVRAVMSLVRMQKSDSGDCTVIPSLKSGASLHAGVSHPLSTSPTYYYDVCELDPATGAAWTPTGVNLANVKLDRTV